MFTNNIKDVHGYLQIKSIGKIGINQTKKNCIPEQVVFENGNISMSVTDVLNKWKHDFS